METLVISKKEEEKILALWLAQFYKHHSLDAVAAVRTIDDPFQNPLAHTTKSALKVLLNALLGEDINPAEVDEKLQDLLKLQAVQDLSPAHAMGPFIVIKDIIQNTIKKELKTIAQYNDLLEIHNRTDSLLLIAFNYYAQNKEYIYKERLKELKNAQSQILRFAQRHKEKLK